MPQVPLSDRVNSNIQLGTAFFVFLTVALVLFFLWHKFGSDKLGDMLTSSFSPSRGSGKYVVSKN